MANMVINFKENYPTCHLLRCRLPKWSSTLHQTSKIVIYFTVIYCTLTYYTLDGRLDCSRLTEEVTRSSTLHQTSKLSFYLDNCVINLPIEVQLGHLLFLGLYIIATFYVWLSKISYAKNETFLWVYDRQYIINMVISTYIQKMTKTIFYFILAERNSHLLQQKC